LNTETNKPNVLAVIFDMDGVIVDSEPIHVEAFKIFMDELDVTYTESFLHSFIGFSIKDNVTKINNELLRGREIDISEGVLRRDAIYLDLIKRSKLKPLPGLFEVIDYCQSVDLPLALASSSIGEQVDVILDRLTDHRINFNTLFSSIVHGDHVEHRKPAPDIYQLSAKNLGLPARNCITIEDSNAGVAAAKNAGIRCIALKNQYIPEEKLKHADFVIGHMREAIPIIEQLRKGNENE
jgi:HAD superfamily hydrolase (TIGR01509 family)